MGLIISSHGSQTINLVFAHPSSAHIELSPAFYNTYNAKNGEPSGIFHQFGFGGNIINETILNSNSELFGSSALCSSFLYDSVTFPLSCPSYIGVSPIFTDHCTRFFSTCANSAYCIEKKQMECLTWQYTLRSNEFKNLNFIFPYSKLRPLVLRALQHLESKCNGRWLNIKPKKNCCRQVDPLRLPTWAEGP
jgi:hypothetical protein